MAEQEVDPFQELPNIRDDEFVAGVVPVAGAIFCWTNRRVFRFKNDRWEETKFFTMAPGPAA